MASRPAPLASCKELYAASTLTGSCQLQLDRTGAPFGVHPSIGPIQNTGVMRTSDYTAAVHVSNREWDRYGHRARYQRLSAVITIHPCRTEELALFEDTSMDKEIQILTLRCTRNLNTSTM